MKVAYLEEADQTVVAEVVRNLLKARGALVTEFTHTRVKFEGFRRDDYSFTKGGTVGVYQRVGEKEVQLRIKVEATIPSRIFWRTVFIELLAAFLLLAWNPSPTAVTLGAVGLWTGFVVVFLIYLGTWRTSAALEREILRDLVETLRVREDGPKAIELAEERSLREFEEDLDAEVAKARMKATRTVAAAPTPAAAPAKAKAGGFKLPAFSKKKDAPTDEAAAAKAARIAALREELERRKKSG